MFFRVICVIAFFGLLNEVNSAALNPEEKKEQILAAQEEATIKVLTATLSARKIAELNDVLETKAMNYYDAAMNKNEFQLKVELIRKMTDDKKNRLKKKLLRLAGKNEEFQADVVLAKDLLNQIEEMEKYTEQQIKKLTDIESAAKIEWETFEKETQETMTQAEDMKKKAVEAVVKAFKLTAANSEDLVENYPNLATRDAAQKACVDYFKNRVGQLMHGPPESLEFYEDMKKLWIKGQKEFVKSTA